MSNLTTHATVEARTTAAVESPRATRRGFLALALAAGVGATAWRAFGAEPSPAEAKPFGHVDRKDPRLDKLIPRDAQVERIANGFTWVEGPVWVKDGGYLLFSEIPENRIFRWKQGEGLKVFIHPSGYTGTEKRVSNAPRDEPGTNGLTLDNEGRLVACAHGDRCVVRFEKDGKRTVLADRYEGKRFNSPNDLCYDSKGNLYFTDPPYGLAGNINDPKKELPYQGVYRLSHDGKLTLLTQDLSRPNGIALSPDEKTLYVAVSAPDAAVYMAYDLADDGTLGKGRVFFDATPWVKGNKGLPDGIKVDREGNLWGAGPGGLHVFAPDGKHLGTIVSDDLPIANLNWGDDGSVLYMASNTSMIRLKTSTKGKLPGGKE